MSFYSDELYRIEDAELFLMGVSLAELGYDEMSWQLRFDVLALKPVIDGLRRKSGRNPSSP